MPPALAYRIGWTLLVSALLGLAAPGARAQAPIRFPTEGRVHALVVFVQFPGEPDGAGDYGSDADTEWPHARSLGPDRALPRWAEGDAFLAPPGTPPDAFEAASLSAFYHTMSGGRFAVTGHVYPQVVHPAHGVDWYHANRGSDANGAVRLAREVLTAPGVRDFVAARGSAEVFDTIRNGTTEHGADGVFDLVVLLHRDPVLPRLRRGAAGEPLAGSSITSLGADPEDRGEGTADAFDPATDAFGADPVRLGGLRVVDNLVSGSGVTGYALTRRQAVRIVAHELGHRHFGPYHTCDSRLSPDADCLGVMGGAYLTFSAGDRIKLGWAEVVPVDVPAAGRLDLALPDALASGTVFRLRDGADACGDVIVEARFWSNPWDAPPEGHFAGMDDGDAHDLFLPQEGLYLYKAPVPGDPRCGGSRDPAYDYRLFSSLENNGGTRRLAPYDARALVARAFRMGGTYRTAFAEGDAYRPYARPRFFYHRHARLDAMLSIARIERADGAFTAEVWMDHLAGPVEAGTAAAAFPNPFADATTVAFVLADAARVRVEVVDALGRHVRLLADGLHQAGTHHVPFRPDPHAPSGRYWARVTVGEGAAARRFTVPLVRVKHEG